MALNSVINRIEAHQNRIKDVLLVNPGTLNFENIDTKLLDKTNKWLLTASSDGFIKIWSFDTEQVSIEIYRKKSLIFFPFILSWIENQLY